MLHLIIKNNDLFIRHFIKKTKVKINIIQINSHLACTINKY